MKKWFCHKELLDCKGGLRKFKGCEGKVIEAPSQKEALLRFMPELREMGLEFKPFWMVIRELEEYGIFVSITEIKNGTKTEEQQN